jgi:Mn2+/Fe2+ NRAMP family transporter
MSGPWSRAWPPPWLDSIGRDVGLLLTFTAGMILWIVLWAVNFKAFDAFLITLLMVILAATARMLVPYLPGNRPGPD